MSSIMRVESVVLPGRRLELSVPDFPEGAKVQVTVEVQGRVPDQLPSMLEFLAALPPAPLLFNDAEEVKRYIEEERDSWDR